MKNLRSVLGVLLAVTLATATMGACRGSDTNDKPDGGGNNGGIDAVGGGNDVTIQEVQSANMAVGTGVTLRGVVVVAIDAYATRTGTIYVMEPGGGEFSGVEVGTDVTAASGVAVGDLVDITNAVKDEFTLETRTCERTSDCTITQLEAPQGGSIAVTKVGTGTVPAPKVLNPWDLAADDLEAEKWESVLIQFNDVAIMSDPREVSTGIDEMRITGPFSVNSGLTDIKSAAKDDCYASITGIGNYFFSYKILPRSAADLASGGTGCLPSETGVTMCADNDDNDRDGFPDCKDFSCLEDSTVTTCDSPTTAIQDGTLSRGDAARLNDVVVTAIAFNKKHLWVQDAGGAAVYNGVYVFRGSAPVLDTAIKVGSVVDVVGSVAEFTQETGADVRTLTQLRPGSVTWVSDGATPANLGPVTVAQLLAADGGKYEGVLLTIENVKVVDVPVAPSFAFSVGTASEKLFVDDSILRYTPTAAECMTIVGIAHYNPFDFRVSVLPVVGGVTAGTCL